MKNILFIGRIAAILVFTASSGFTTILHFCTMEASECCDASGASDHHACPAEEESSPLAGAAVISLNYCHINAVVGGLSPIQAVLENASKVQNVSVLALLVPTFVSFAPSINPSSFIRSDSESVFPPSVEKYVLNETFLI